MKHARNFYVRLRRRLRKMNLLAQVEGSGEAPGQWNERRDSRSSIERSLKLIGNVIFGMYQKVFFLDQWYLLFDLSANDPILFSHFKKLVPRKDRFWADPHAIQVDNKYYIFIEEYLYRRKKGHISVVAVDGQGNCEAPVPVLEREYHLSYPFVFEWEGKYYLIPESAENKTIELYECTKFPSEWKLKKHLMENVNAVDSTLLHHHGKWWLFTGIAENEDSLPFARLFLFYSDTLWSKEWIPHPLNPIISDERKGRPAGRIFIRNGTIHRPSQDCSRFYGYGFDLNEIAVLSETEYVEKRVASVRPDWDESMRATHTFAREKDLIVIDGLMRRRRFF